MPTDFIGWIQEVDGRTVGTGVVTEDWESGIERAFAMDGAAARKRVVERYSVPAVFPRMWAAIQSALGV